MAKGVLYLMPSGLGGQVAPLLPGATLAVLQRVQHFIVENQKTARAFLKAAGYVKPLQHALMQTLDEHTRSSELAALLKPLEEGIDCALLSEAGCPAIADPGASLVRLAHAAGIRVVPLVGPSALLLAIMASGMNGQRFAFQGYLPVERSARVKKLREIETESHKENVTQIFIEAPYRNDALLETILSSCHDDTLLCVAVDLTLETESVRTCAVREWKVNMPRLDRRPTVFLVYREPEGRSASRR